MASSILNSDDGVISGTAGLKSVGGDDGNLVFQSKGTETARINTDKQIVAAAGTASLPIYSTTGDLNTGIFFPAADTIAFAEGGAEAMRIDSSGNVLVGTDVAPGSNGGGISIYRSDFPRLTFRNSTTGTTVNDGMQFVSVGNDFYIANLENAPVIFQTNGTERARITSGGYFKASNNGSYADATGNFHEIRQTANETSAQIRATSASYTANVLVVEADRNTTNNTYYAIGFFHGGAGAFKFRVADSGNVTNTNGSYGTISDFKLKQDIVDAGNQWDDIKNLRFRKYRLKSDVEANPDAKPMLGLVAQEAELVSPGLIEEHKDTTQETRTREISAVLDEDGNEIEPARTEEYTETVDLGTTTKSIKTSILYMKAVKALQEAMKRIETLEAKVSALEANNGA